jgi:Cys-Gly metallodipeptidase DUG1
VPNLTIKETTELVVKYVNAEFKKIGSKNRCEVALTHGGEPWIADPNVSYSSCARSKRNLS